MKAIGSALVLASALLILGAGIAVDKFEDGSFTKQIVIDGRDYTREATKEALPRFKGKMNIVEGNGYTLLGVGLALLIVGFLCGDKKKEEQ